MDQHILQAVHWTVLPGPQLPNLLVNLVSTFLKCEIKKSNFTALFLLCFLQSASSDQTFHCFQSAEKNENYLDHKFIEIL